MKFMQGPHVPILKTRNFGWKTAWPFFSRKPPALTSINQGKSATNPEIASINVCSCLIVCNFPTLSVQILTAPLQIGTQCMGFSAQFPAKKGPENLMGSQHPSPNVKTLCNFEPDFWPEIITSRDAESTLRGPNWGLFLYQRVPH